MLASSRSYNKLILAHEYVQSQLEELLGIVIPCIKELAHEDGILELGTMIRPYLFGPTESATTWCSPTPIAIRDVVLAIHSYTACRRSSVARNRRHSQLTIHPEREWEMWSVGTVKPYLEAGASSSHSDTEPKPRWRDQIDQERVNKRMGRGRKAKIPWKGRGSWSQQRTSIEKRDGRPNLVVMRCEFSIKPPLVVSTSGKTTCNQKQ
jgi:hypothetical protein